MASSTDENSNVLFALILAAGGSSRLGRPKQLLQVAGQPLIRRILATASKVCGPRTLLVLGASWQRVLAAAGEQSGFFTVNERWSAGMGASLALGIGGLPSDCDGALVMLCDQPRIDALDLRRLIAGWRSAPEKIAASRYGETVGAPAIFPATLFSELQEIAGDRGARDLIRRRGANLITVDCPNAALDVDNSTDVEKLRRLEERGSI